MSAFKTHVDHHQDIFIECGATKEKIKNLDCAAEAWKVDIDGDGIGNNEDTDDDNDGTEDGEDTFPIDPNETRLNDASRHAQTHHRQAKHRQRHDPDRVLDDVVDRSRHRYPDRIG